MNTTEFIEKIGAYVQKYAPAYGICVHSPIIAQAVLESARGTSELAVKANNYFGLKYKPGRCPTATGSYTKVGSEQKADGTYTSASMQWFAFPDMEACVRGYFDFINTPRYANLKGVTTPREYLQNIRADGYATSLKYVDNLMAVIREYNLTRFDEGKKVEGMSNSTLATYTRISPNKTSPRNHKIDTITIHCMAGNLTVERCGEGFAKRTRMASSNYGIGSDGRIGLYVEEKDRSWCSSNKANDMRAVTIEVANDGGAATGWHVSDAAMTSLIALVTDICQRNGIKQLLWKGDKSLIGQVDKQNMTVHRWFKNKACPGDYLYGKHAYIAAEVNKRLGVTETQPAEQPASSNYKVRITASTLNVRAGAGTSYKVTTTVKKGGIYTITAEQNGWGKLKSGAGWISLKYTERV